MLQPLRRRAALSLVALAASVPLLAVGTAYAEPAPTPTTQGRPVVHFTGVCLLVLCLSKPDIERLTVEADSTVTFVNGLGRPAWLYLDGQVFDPNVPDGSGVEVRFSHGPVRVSMGQDGHGGNQPVTVSVVAASPTTDPSGAAADPPSVPGTAPVATLQPATPPGPGAGSGADRSTGTTVPGENTGGTVGVPGGALPGSGERSGASGAGDAAVGGAAVGGAAPQGDRKPEPAAQPLAAARPVGDGGMTGLLALVAAVCVVGASACAIRAIIAQRATRTGAA